MPLPPYAAAYFRRAAAMLIFADAADFDIFADATGAADAFH